MYSQGSSVSLLQHCQLCFRTEFYSAPIFLNLKVCLKGLLYKMIVLVLTALL